MLQKITLCLGWLLLAACHSTVWAGEIPKGYRGVFAPTSGAWQLELKEGQAFWREGQQNYKLPVEREPYAKIYAKLGQGKAGLYITEPTQQTTTLTGYGVLFTTGAEIPAQSGLTWRRARVFYFTLNREQSALVDGFSITTSSDGLVTLDTLNAAWQIGWGPSAEHYDLQRVK